MKLPYMNNNSNNTSIQQTYFWKQIYHRYLWKDLSFTLILNDGKIKQNLSFHAETHSGNKSGAEELQRANRCANF